MKMIGYDVEFDMPLD